MESPLIARVREVPGGRMMVPSRVLWVILDMMAVEVRVLAVSRRSEEKKQGQADS